MAGPWWSTDLYLVSDKSLSGTPTTRRMSAKVTVWIKPVVSLLFMLFPTMMPHLIWSLSGTWTRSPSCRPKKWPWRCTACPWWSTFCSLSSQPRPITRVVARNKVDTAGLPSSRDWCSYLGWAAEWWLGVQWCPSEGSRLLQLHIIVYCIYIAYLVHGWNTLSNDK